MDQDIPPVAPLVEESLPLESVPQPSRFETIQTFLRLNKKTLLFAVAVVMVVAILFTGIWKVTHRTPTESARHSAFASLLAPEAPQEQETKGSFLARFLAAISPISSSTPAPEQTASLTPESTSTTVPTATPRASSSPTPTSTATAKPTSSPTSTTGPIATATPAPQTGLPDGAENTTSYSPRVLAIGYNPTENGVGLTDRYFIPKSSYGSSEALENSVFSATKDAFASLSHGAVQFQIVRTMHVTSFPSYSDGFTYTLGSYHKCVYGDPQYDAAYCEQHKLQFDYARWVRDNRVCEIAKEVQADEIWVISNPYIMAWEAFMIGPDSGFNVNGANFTVSGCDKHYIVMAATYDRPENMLHDIGHRVEATMRYLTSNWKDEDIQNHWERFAALRFYDGQTPSGTYCGNAHHPSNAFADYNYTDQQSKDSNCQDWQNFPNYTNQTQSISCSAWGCSDAGWQQYWLSYLPHQAGKVQMTTRQGNAFYFLKNWWTYLLFPENAIAAKRVM